MPVREQDIEPAIVIEVEEHRAPAEKPCIPAEAGRICAIFERVVAIVDCDDTFDLASAAHAGVDLKRTLWVRCGHSLERAFKAVDLILHAGGFGLIVLNLCNVPAKTLRRVISSWWFRFRRAIENTPTALVVVTPVAAVRSCAALALELKRDRAMWPSTLSLVSDNGRIARPDQSGPRLSLVQTVPTETYDTTETYSHFLQSIRICMNRERPVGIPPVKIDFYPHRGLA